MLSLLEMTAICTDGGEANHVLSEGLMLGMYYAGILRQHQGGPLFQRSAVCAATSLRRV